MSTAICRSPPTFAVFTADFSKAYWERPSRTSSQVGIAHCRCFKYVASDFEIVFRWSIFAFPGLNPSTGHHMKVFTRQRHAPTFAHSLTNLRCRPRRLNVRAPIINGGFRRYRFDYATIASTPDSLREWPREALT